MATLMGPPRSGDEVRPTPSDRPIDLEAGQTVEADPPIAGPPAEGGFLGIDFGPKAAPPPPAPTPPASNLVPVPPPAPAPAGSDHFLGIDFSAKPSAPPAAEAAPPPPPAAPPPPPAAPPAPPEGPPTATAASGQPPAPKGPRLRRQQRGRRRWDFRAWAISAAVHVAIIGALAAVATGSGEVVRKLANLDSALVVKDGAVEELTPILADPNDSPREEAAGDANADPTMAFTPSSGGTAGAVVLKSTGRAMGERTALPTVSTVSAPSNLSMVSTMPTRDLGGGGLISGDVTHAVNEIGDALDQIAREILRHLSQHKVTVVWLFDESESMRDDQKAIKSKFDRVVNELKVNAPAEAAKKGKKNEPPLTHAIVGFGDDIHFEQEKPTADIDAIGRAIDRLKIDTTGNENTMSAVGKVIKHYDNLISSDHKLLIVLATDESGDDGDLVEEARQVATRNKVPIYVIGRQALLGTDKLTVEYHDPVTKDLYWVTIRRGPETADVEALQYDGIHRRWDEVPSGFAPYEMARLTKDTGGIYFLLPSEEETRVRRREKAYSMATLKEYVPDYESRAAYADHRNKSELRRTIREVIAATAPFEMRHRYSVITEELLGQVAQDLPVITDHLAALVAIEKRLRGLEKARDRETDKRWQAAYDLMLAQVVVFQIKAYEYKANLLEMGNKPLKPKVMPAPELTVLWSLDHSHEAKAPKESTEKVYAEALRLCKLVIERHPNTPWADLAQDEINRGFSVKRDEWHHRHSAKYEERRKLVPKF